MYYISLLYHSGDREHGSLLGLGLRLLRSAYPGPGCLCDKD